MVNAETGEIIIPANRKITKTLLRKLANVYDHIEIDPRPIRNKINEIIGSLTNKFDELADRSDEAMDRVEAGDEVDPGIIKQVKVYIACKRKLRSATRWPDATVTKAWSPRSFPKKTCRSWRMERRWTSC